MESGFLLVLAGLMGTSQIGRVIPLAGVSSSVGILRKWGCMVMVTLIVFCLHLNPSSAESSHKMATSYYDEGRCSKAACHRDALCFSTGKSYRCKCKEGFYGSGKICLDDNECDFENGGCAHHCANTAGNYTCSCLEGFRLDSDGHNCIDVDECFQTSGCHHICLNTIGGYECACRDGFSLAPDGKTCVTASSWCQEQYGCSHFCQSSAAGMMCACRRGFQLHPNGKNCTASCRRGNGGCHHKCRDTFEGPVCGCQEKYVLAKDRHTCLATCGANNGGCDRICNNTLFGPKCSCPPGYTLHSNGKTCIDVDECAAANGGCSYRCVNTEGSFDCLCPSGYKTDRHQRTCIDIDECSWNRTCDHHCRNENGGYRCYCRDGYDLYGQTHCADRDECSVNNGGCHHRCTNTEGSFRCECDQGYRLHPNKRDCVVQTRSCEPLQLPPKTSMICSDVETSPSPLVATTSSMQRLQTVQSSQQQQQQQQQRLQAERVCRLMCKGNAEFVRTSSEFPENFTTNCGPSTEFQWSHELEDLSLPTCSDQVLAPGYQSRAKFTFMAENCKTKRKSVQEVEKQLGTILIDDSSSGSRCENGFCRVKVVNLKCDNRKRRLIRHLAPNQVLISAEFEMHVKPVYPKEACDVDCSREQSIRQLKKALKRLRTHINSNNKLLIRYEGKNYEVLKSSLKSFKPKNTCDIGQVLNDRKCVACSVSTFYSISSGLCESCPTGFYQDKEGQLTCLPCQASPEFRRGQAQQAYGCKDLCEPGNYSNDGLKPCQPCASGSYQPDYGRAMCISCGPGVMTSGVGSTGFHQCNVSESCRPGNFYDRTKKRCLPCPANTYQPEARKDYCISCPGQTQTDNEASTDLSQCKNRQCIGETSARLGFLQSPNWPGLYPADVECTWKISSEKGRRILVVIPEMHLASTSGQCEDSLVMRKAASPNSVLTFEICNSSRTPIAFTAKSRTLWIRFKADSTIHAKGFSIPYVTYSDDYQELIEDIVSDQKLYQHHQHQQVLQDRQLLSALLEVIEQPYNYFKYANVSHSMFPQSFIDLLRNKVIKFFGYNK